MSSFARVISLDVLREFKGALQEFAEQAGLALSEATSDVQRTIWWLQHDQLAHWQRELKKRNEKLAQARSDLHRAQLASNDTRTSAVVERKAVAKWERAVDEAEQKIRNVKKWHQMLEREMMLFKAQLGQVSGAVAGDIPVAVGRMDKMIRSLEAYLSIAAPSEGTMGSAIPANIVEGISLETLASTPAPPSSSLSAAPEAEAAQ
jgi:hypothetical protein